MDDLPVDTDPGHQEKRPFSRHTYRNGPRPSIPQELARRLESPRDAGGSRQDVDRAPGGGARVFRRPPTGLRVVDEHRLDSHVRLTGSYRYLEFVVEDSPINALRIDRDRPPYALHGILEG